MGRRSSQGVERLFESLPGLYWTCLPDGRLDFASPQLARFTGFSAEELERGRWEECVHADDRLLVEAAVTRAAAEGSPWRASFRVRARDGQFRWVDAQGAPERSEAGRVDSWAVGAVELDLGRCGPLIETEARFRTLFNAMDEGFQLCELVFDERGRADDFRVLEVNPAFERQTGLTRDRVIGRTAREILPDLERHWIDLYVGVAESGKPARHEGFAAGVGRWYDVYAFSPAKGQFAALSRDITERRRAEEALRRSEAGLRETAASLRQANEQLVASQERYRLAGLATHDVLWEWDLASDRVAWSEATELAFGFRREEMPCEFSWWCGRIHPDDRARTVDGIQAAVARPGERSWQAEYRLQHRDGTWRHVLDRGYIVRDERGRGLRMIGSILDLTERKRAEEELRRSREELRHLADAMPQLVWITRPDGSAEFFNRNWCEYTGTSLEDSQGDAWSRVLHPHDRDRTLERWHHSLETGETYEVEYRMRSASQGDYRWFLARAVPIRDRGGRIVRWFGTCTDIQEQRQAAEALQQSRDTLHAVLDSAPAAVVVVGAEGQVLMANRATERILGGPVGGTAREPRDGTRLFLADGSPLPNGALPLAEALQGRTVTDSEILVTRPDGRRATLLASATPLRTQEGAVRGAITVLQDITERKRAAEDLAEAKARLEVILANLPAGVFLADAEGRLIEVNERARAIWGAGAGAADALGREGFRGRWPDSHRLLAPEEWALARALKKGETVVGEMVDIERFDGGSATILNNAAPFHDRSGNITGAVVVVQDVTEIKRAEKALRESEARARERYADLEQIYRHAPVGLVTFDRDCRFLRINQAMADINGLPVEAHLGKTVEEVLPNLAPGLREAFRPVLERGERVLGLEVHGATPAQPEVERDWIGTYYPLRSGTGEVVGLTGAVLEVTERKRAERALRESEELARMSLDAASLGIWKLDLTSGAVFFDERAAEHYGFPSRRTTLGEVLARVHPEDAPRLTSSIQDSLRPGSEGHYEIEYRLVHPDGEVRWLSVHARVHFEGQGQRRRAVFGAGTSMDVTDRKAAEERLRQANEQLLEGDKRKNEFLAMLSHELRNPLAPIRNSLYLLERATPGGQQATRAHQVIERQVGHMTRLIDDLLDVTRITRGKIRLQREGVELGELVRRTAEDHRSMFAANEVHFEVDLRDQPLRLPGDPTRLAQVVGNLLGNAAKFTPRGGHVELSLREVGGEAEIRVRDDGAGIDPELLTKLFEPFVQADTTLDRSRGGLGLGLALVKGLVELHGGSVRVTSEGPGRGSEFVVRLPVEREPVPGGRSVGGGGDGPGKRPLRLLLIEDNPDGALSLKEVLELDGHQVEVSPTGLEGIQKAREWRPDVVLCDIGLPGIDGFEVARRMRADPGLREVPLLALSGYATAEDVERAREAGFVEHLAKPPDLEKLERAMTGALARRLGSDAGHPTPG